MVVALWITAAVACCGLCAYAIARAVRRSRARREAAVPR
jgi:hypothetical protein